MEPLIPPMIFNILFGALLVSLAFVVYRTVRGPHVLDRLLTLDVIALIIICLIVVWELAVGTTYFFDAVLVLVIIGFISTVAIAKYLEHGDLIE